MPVGFYPPDGVSMIPYRSLASAAELAAEDLGRY